MTISAAVLDAMIAAGATAEVIAAAVKVDIAENEARIEARIERKRAGNAERQRRFRDARNASNALQGVSNALSRVTEVPIIKHARAGAQVRADDSSSSSVDTGKKDRKNICPISPEKIEKRERQRSVEEAFSEFWKAYPRRVGDNPRKTALASYERAIANGVVPETILAGTRRLAAKHPTPTPFVPMAATWLNQERWEDGQPGGEPAARVTTIAEDYADDPEFLRANGFM